VMPCRVLPEHRANFRHLYWDVMWFGVSAASAMAFLSVYATRLNATELQIGLISAGPAAVSLIFTLPWGWWLQRRSISPAVFWMSVFHRAFYFLWILVPLLPTHSQVITLIWLVLLMSVPGAALAVGFNALFANTVPPECRGHVVGVRNGMFAIAFIVISLVSGRILDKASFPMNYQVVFAIGALGAAFSSLHLKRIRPPETTGPYAPQSLGDIAWPGMVRLVVDGLRPGGAQRFLVKSRRLIRTEIVRGPYGTLMAAVFTLHVALFLALPLFPVHWVRNLGLSDGEIGLGTATFYLCVLAGSSILSRLVELIGNQLLSAIGVVFMSTYPALMGASTGLGLFLVASALGGFGWSLVGGALTNYVLEKVPDHDRPAHLAWYNLAVNAGLLAGSLLGPIIASPLGMVLALVVFSVCRLAGAVFIWRLG
jgi:MFS family permease